MKRRISSILLIFVFIAPILLTYSWLQCQKGIVKKQVKKQLIATIDKDELVLLKFSKVEAETKLKWEHSKEFEFNHQMYDVVESETFGDSIYYWCWWDHEETALNQLLKELVQYALNNDTQNKTHQNKLITYLKSLYCIDNLEWNTSGHFAAQPHYSNYSTHYFSFSISPPVPPPRLC